MLSAAGKKEQNKRGQECGRVLEAGCRIREKLNKDLKEKGA